MTNIRSGRSQIWIAILASVVILTGIQLILPALPVIQSELGLSDSQIALVTSAYLLPSIFLAFPAGLLAGRFGRRPVFVSSLTLFGLCGLALLFSRTFYLIIAIRVLQGMAFAAIHPLSITMIGDARSGVAQVSAQGQRMAMMSISDAGLPVIGGLLVGLAWFAPFALQLVTIPLAVAAWFLLPKNTGSRKQPDGYLKQLFDVLKEKTSLILQVSGFLRFLFKFAFLTYLPILMVSKLGLSPTLAGVALGIAAVGGIAMGALSGRMVRLAAPSRITAISLILIAVAFFIISINKSVGLLLLACLMFGLADGIYGVFQNALIAQASPADQRAAFIAASGSVRNLGKFIAPTLLGLSVLVLPLELSFALMGVLAIAALLTIPLLSSLDQRLTSDVAEPQFPDNMLKLRSGTKKGVDKEYAYR
jgi:MFS family permease